MGVERTKKSEIVLAVNPDTMAVGHVFEFSYRVPVDESVMMTLRGMLGLSGGKALDLPVQERGRIATILLRNNFLTAQEVNLLGGKVVKMET